MVPIYIERKKSNYFSVRSQKPQNFPRDSPPPKHGRHSSSDADALEIATMLSKACKLSGLGSPRKPDRTGESSLIL